MTDSERPEAAGSTLAPDSLFIGGPGIQTAALPDGLDAIRVPMTVEEPAVSYFVEARSAAMADSMTLSDPPSPKRIKPRSTGYTDVSGSEALQPSLTVPAAVPSASAPLDLTDFESLNFNDNALNTGGFLFIPADASGAAGPEHVVSVTNVSVQFHTKDGTPLLDSALGNPVTGISLASFFSSLGPANATFDPKVIYDQFADRFVIVTLERQDALFDGVDTSRILVAVSDDSDPTGTWYFGAIDSKLSIDGTDQWADYPGFAVDEEAVYITANMFEFFSTGGFFCCVRMWVIDKFTGAGGGFYGGGAGTAYLFDPYASAGFASGTQPAHLMGGAPADPSVGTLLVSYDGLTNDSGNEGLQVIRIDNPVGPGPTTFTHQFVDIGDIEVPTNPLPDAPQLGTPALLDTNDRRTLNAVWRDDSLWLTTTIDPASGDDAGQATAYWLELDTSNLASITVAQQGGIGGEDIAEGTHTFFPSIAVNDSGDAVIGFTAASDTIYPTSAYTTRSAALPAGTTSGSQVLRDGLDFYERTFSGDSSTCPSSRWGDYSGISVDPYDQCFWVYNKHALGRGTTTSAVKCGSDENGVPEDGVWGTAFGFVCESCRTNLDLVGDTTTVQSLEARDRIDVSMGAVTGTGDLTLTSNVIAFGSEFEVRQGGVLSANIGPCSP